MKSILYLPVVLLIPMVGCDHFGNMEVNALNDPIAFHILNEKMEPPSDSNPVSMIARIFPKRSKGLSRSKLAVRIDLAKGWSIGKIETPNSGARRTQLKLKLPKGAVAKGDWTTTAMKVATSSDGSESLEKQVVFKRRVDTDRDFDPEKEISVSISYQACKAGKQMPTRTVKVIVE